MRRRPDSHWSSVGGDGCRASASAANTAAMAVDNDGREPTGLEHRPSAASDGRSWTISRSTPGGPPSNWGGQGVPATCPNGEATTGTRGLSRPARPQTCRSAKSQVMTLQRHRVPQADSSGAGSGHPLQGKIPVQDVGREKCGRDSSAPRYPLALVRIVQVTPGCWSRACIAVLSVRAAGGQDSGAFGKEGAPDAYAEHAGVRHPAGGGPGLRRPDRLRSIAVWHPRRRNAGGRGRLCSGAGQSARWKGTLVMTTRGRDCRMGCSLSVTCSCKMRCHQCRSTSSGTATVSVRSGRCSCRVQR